MNTKIAIRNILVISGAHYLPYTILTMIWWRISFLFRGHSTYKGLFGEIIVFILATLPMLISASISGLASGYTIESRRPLVWASILATLIFFTGFFSIHWQRPISSDKLLIQIMHGLAPAIISVLSYTFIRTAIRRR